MEPVQGIKGIDAVRVDQAYRITYERIPGDIIRVRSVGRHNYAPKKTWGIALLLSGRFIN